MKSSGSLDDTKRLWDVTTGKALVPPLTGHEGEFLSVCFSLDGKILASGSWDKTIQLRDWSLESWKAQACSIANRNLTLEKWRQYMGDMSYLKGETFSILTFL